MRRDEFGTFGDVSVNGPDIDIFGGSEATLTDTRRRSMST